VKFNQSASAYADSLISFAAHGAFARAVPHFYFVAALFGRLPCAETIVFRRIF
jgi:hypothetical protein